MSIRLNRFRVLVFAIGSVAALLRLVNLGTHTLWYDEVMLVYETRYLGQTLAERMTFHPPLFIVALKPFALLSENEWVIRAFPALMGVLTCLATIWLGVELLSPSAALLGGAFLAISPFAIFFSQQLRPYSLFSFLACLNMVFGAKLLVNDRWHRGSILGYLTSTLLIIYTHFFTGFLILAYNVVFVINLSKLKRRIKAWVGIQGLTILMYLPILSFALLITTSVVEAKEIWIQKVTLRTIYESLKYYSVGFYMTGLEAKLVLGLTLSAIAAGMWSLRRKWGALSFLSSCLITPIAAMAIVSIVTQPIYLERSIIFVLIPFSLLIGQGISQIPPPWARVVIPVVTFLAFSPFLLQQYGNENFPHPNRTACPRMEAKQAAEYIRTRWRPNDFVCHSHLHGLMPFLYYLADKDQAYVLLRPEQKNEVLGVFTFPIEGTERTITRYGAQFLLLDEVLAAHDRVWFVFSRPGINNELDDFAKEVLGKVEEAQWRRTAYQRFMGIELYLYCMPQTSIPISRD